MVFTIATISVSWIWFLCLAIVGRIVGNFDTKGTLLKMVNKLSALIIWGVAVYIAVQLYKML
ncbi:hypothetical protein B4113_1339 [Geobacillus sp. B4113_201601]|nr:hypothetical protein B4113_1339 [Geobacillus sp. B4113_201601]